MPINRRELLAYFAADLSKVHDGGFEPSVDFRQIYANVLQDWLRVDPVSILGEPRDPFRVLA